MKKTLAIVGLIGSLVASSFAANTDHLPRLTKEWTGTTTSVTNTLNQRTWLSSILVVTDTPLSNECKINLVTEDGNTNLLFSTEGAVANFEQFLVVLDGEVNWEKFESLEIVNSASADYRLYVTHVYP